MESAKKVALNTGFLYGKMLITIVISLYSTRLVLQALGVKDFGIFNLVAGIIAFLSFINSALAISTQRYLSFYLGANRIDELRKVFSSSVILHLIIGISAIVLLEILGIFLFNGILNIPNERIDIARMVYHLMVVSTFFTINSVPYDAAIITHEDLLFESILGVVEAILKLAIAFYLISTVNDRLLFYGIFTALLIIIIRITKSIFCTLRYQECTTHVFKYFVPSMFKEMFGFTGWNLFGTFVGVIRNQGLAVILNVYIGVIVNAAYGIANQVNAQLNAFSGNINKAIKPQIFKSEGSGNRPRMIKLSMFSCKVAFFLLAIFSLPLIFEMKYVLNLWLGELPAYANGFCILVLLNSLVSQLTWGLGVAISSVGDIKKYQVITGFIVLINIPVAILLLQMGYSPYFVLMASLAINIIAGGSRIFFAKLIAGLNVKVFLKDTVLRSVLSIVITASILYIPINFFRESFLRLIITTVTSTVLLLLFARFVGLTKDEYNLIKGLFENIFHRIFGRKKKMVKIRS